MLNDGGSASDAVVAAILSAAAVHSGVFLGPVVAMVGGVGAGTRLFDGRTRQPGLGARRPRGFTKHDTIAPAARCAVPRSMATLALMHAYSTKRPLSALTRCARATSKLHVELADEGHDARLDLLDTLPERGAVSLAHLGPELIRVAGPGAGGLLCERDLQQAQADDSRPAFRAIDGAELARPAWDEAAPDDGPRTASLQHTHVVVAADGHGLVAAASYSAQPDGLFVPALGVRLALAATPVMRGVPRVTPGTTLWAPHAIGLLRRGADGWFAAIGAAGAERLPERGLAPSTAPIGEQVSALRAATSATRAVMATVERGQTSALAS